MMIIMVIKERKMKRDAADAEINVGSLIDVWVISLFSKETHCLIVHNVSLQGMLCFFAYLGTFLWH